ncbi:MAG: nucleotidyltransferase domain-containing protein [Clostridia bacterium]|nr:nucleotidyltransferase domain-containing protein [Clostridia bacterium]
MFQLQSYLDRFVSECRTAFGDRLLYVGLQGSYLRGEAHADSDIDIMLVLDRMSVDDMETYRDILKRIGYYEKSCGFICGADELKRWNPLEVCQLSHTTKDIFGCLNDHLPNAARADEINYVKYSLGNLYHELCHRYIHADREKNRERFRNSCKGIFFLLQNLHYLESGTFAVTKEELRSLVSEEDRIVLSITDLPEEYDFDHMFRLVFDWIRNAFVRIERIK